MMVLKPEENLKNWINPNSGVGNNVNRGVDKESGEDYAVVSCILLLI